MICSNYFSSKEWASRAKREDLCAMSAEKRSKYYLCSVHFTDDCFVDGSRHKLRKSNHPFTISNPTKFHNNLEQVTSQLKLNSHNYIQYNRKPCGKYSSCGVSDMIKYEEVYDNPEDEPANIITVQRKRNTDVYLLTEDMIVEQVQDEVVEQADEDDYIICRLCCNEINLEDDNIPIFEEDSTNFTEEAMNIERLMPDKLVSFANAMVQLR